jgi:hypothetical protein
MTNPTPKPTSVHFPDLATLPPDPRRRTAPAVQRNREPILAVLKDVLPDSGAVLELASGTGEHATFFAAHLPALTWQPSDVDPNNILSIVAWTEACALHNVLSPLVIDLADPPQPGPPQYQAAFCANLIHIAPWQVCQHLMQLVGSSLLDGAKLVLYGPYKVNGEHTSESNAQFEQWLWSQSPHYGVRDMAHVVTEARHNDLFLLHTLAMPANNFCLVLEKRIGQRD